MLNSQHKGRFAYHFTHLENLEKIITNGLLSTNQKIQKDIIHHDIANNDIQHRRSEMVVPCGPGGVVHDYVPFYFTKRSPMLLNVLKTKNIDQELIIYLAIPIETIEGKPVVFSSSSANTLVPPNFYSDSSALNTLNWDIIDAKVWSPKPDQLKQQKMAELLVHNKVNITDISYIVVWDSEIKKIVERLLNKYGITDLKVRYDYSSFDAHYFHNLNAEGRVNIVTGPVFLLSKTKECIQYIKQNSPSKPVFSSLEEAIEKIQADFGCIKELSDIDGLETDNNIHYEDVGAHSRRVASLLKKERAFHELSQREQCILTLAAYLHDIGKGPKSRWPNEIQKVDDTHPLKSLPMLKRILCEEIGGLTKREIRQIVTLVVYDDLIGDIVACGRNEDQLKEVINIQSDLEMLILLAKCDMNAITPRWAHENNAKIEQLKSRMYTYLEESI